MYLWTHAKCFKRGSRGICLSQDKFDRSVSVQQVEFSSVLCFFFITACVARNSSGTHHVFLSAAPCSSPCFFFSLTLLIHSLLYFSPSHPPCFSLGKAQCLSRRQKESLSSCFYHVSLNPQGSITSHCSPETYRNTADQLLAFPVSCITVEPMKFLMRIICFHHKNISLLNIHFIVFVDLSVGHVLLYSIKAALWL